MVGGAKPLPSLVAMVGGIRPFWYSALSKTWVLQRTWRTGRAWQNPIRQRSRTRNRDPRGRALGAMRASDAVRHRDGDRATTTQSTTSVTITVPTMLTSRTRDDPGLPCDSDHREDEQDELHEPAAHQDGHRDEGVAAAQRRRPRGCRRGDPRNRRDSRAPTSRTRAAEARDAEPDDPGADADDERTDGAGRSALRRTLLMLSKFMRSAPAVWSPARSRGSSTAIYGRGGRDGLRLDLVLAALPVRERRPGWRPRRRGRPPPMKLHATTWSATKNSREPTEITAVHA